MTNPEIENGITRAGTIYRFGEFRLDTKRNLLFRDDETVALTYKALQTLTVLIENAGQVVKKEEFMERIWNDTFVEENSLARNISALRKVFNEAPSSNKYIETVPRRGYRFVAAIVKVSVSDEVQNEITFAGEAERDFSLPAKNLVENSDSVNNYSALTDLRPRSNTNKNVYLASGKTFIKKRFASKKYRWFFAALLIIFTFALIIFSRNCHHIFSREQDLFPVFNGIKAATKFTNLGNAVDAIISKDGKYVAYVIDEGDTQSLWVKQTANESAVQIVPPGKVTFQGLSFAPNGDFIYFNLWDKSSVGAIYRIPTLGGMPTKLIEECLPAVAVSPDVKEIAFIRGNSAEGMQAILTADSSDEKTRRSFGKSLN